MAFAALATWFFDIPLPKKEIPSFGEWYSSVVLYNNTSSSTVRYAAIIQPDVDPQGNLLAYHAFDPPITLSDGDTYNVTYTFGGIDA